MERIHVIRQRGKYYSDVLGTKHYMYGFLNKTSAAMYMDFLQGYKKRYSRYPYIEQKHFAIQKDVDSLNNDIVYIESEPIKIMKYMCLVNGVNLFGITEVTCITRGNRDEVNISGIDLTEGESASEEEIISNLEYLHDSY
jgi:hypothetical protein